MTADEQDRPIKKLKTGNSSAASAFFTKSSAKPKSTLSWKVRHETLLCGTFRGRELRSRDSEKPLRVAAFDLDGTLIATKSGNRHAKDETDWKFFDISVPKRLQELHSEGHQIVIFTNQAGVKLSENTKRYAQFKSKTEAIFRALDIPLLLYAATGHDIFRKPRPGMFTEMCHDLDLDNKDVPVALNIDESFFVGDAAGRSAASGSSKRSVDHSSSDRKFALNNALRFFTPEEFFHSAKPEEYFLDGFDPLAYKGPTKRDHLFERLAKQEIVLFVGSPAAGKSTYYNTFLKRLGYVRINQDTLKTRQKCLSVAKEALAEGKSVCVDNTNANIETRNHWLSLAREFQDASIPVRVILFTADVQLCQHNNAVRAFRPKDKKEKRELLPAIAFTSWTSRYEKPTVEEGFSNITEVDFLFHGGKEDQKIWRQYWV